jgi:hypothetical protein
MPRLLPDLRLDPVVRPYVGAPIKEFNELVSQRITDFDESAAKDDLLKSQLSSIVDSTNGFDPDVQYAQNLALKFSERLTSRAKAGDYENMGRETSRDVLEFTKEMQPLIARKQEYATYVQDIQDNDKLLGRQKEAAIKATRQLNSNPLKAGQRLGSISTIKPANYVDFGKLLTDRMAGIESDGKTTLIPNDDGTFTKIKTEEMTSEEVSRIAHSFIMGNPEATDFLTSEQELGNGQMANAEATAAVNAAIDKYAFKDVDVSRQGSRYSTTDRDFKANAGNARTVAIKSPFTQDINFDEKGNIIKTDKSTTLGKLLETNIDTKIKERKAEYNKRKAEGKFTGKEPTDARLSDYLETAPTAVYDYFFNNTEKLSQVEEETKQKIDKGFAAVEETGISKKQYVESLFKAENFAFQEYTPDDIKKESGAFLNVNTGGGLGRTRNVYDEESGQMMNLQQFYKERLDIDINEPSDLEDLKEGITIVGESNDSGKNSIFTNFKVGTFREKTFLIDNSENATDQERMNHTLYKAAKENISGTLRMFDPNSKQYYDIDYSWDPTGLGGQGTYKINSSTPSKNQ